MLTLINTTCEECSSTRGPVSTCSLACEKVETPSGQFQAVVNSEWVSLERGAGSSVTVVIPGLFDIYQIDFYPRDSPGDQAATVTLTPFLHDGTPARTVFVDLRSVVSSTNCAARTRTSTPISVTLVDGPELKPVRAQRILVYITATCGLTSGSLMCGPDSRNRTSVNNGVGFRDISVFGSRVYFPPPPPLPPAPPPSPPYPTAPGEDPEARAAAEPLPLDPLPQTRIAGDGLYTPPGQQRSAYTIGNRTSLPNFYPSPPPNNPNGSPWQKWQWLGNNTVAMILYNSTQDATVTQTCG